MKEANKRVPEPTMDAERPFKRARTNSIEPAMTPPAMTYDPMSAALLNRATHVLTTEATALSRVALLYETDFEARESLLKAVHCIAKSQAAGGKVVVCGVGKSGYIGMKLAATFKSLALAATFMHACEAAHGDLGDIRAPDVLLFISFSAKTPELLNILPHIGQDTRILAMTSLQKPHECPLLAGREEGILLPAPVYESEMESFGVAAPTTSTTVALAVGDMLALTVADKVHEGESDAVFKRNHPGGAIGMTHREVEALKQDGEDFSVQELPSPTLSGKEMD